MKSVYSAVRTGSLNKAFCALCVKGLKCVTKVFTAEFCRVFVSVTIARGRILVYVKRNRSTAGQTLTTWYNRKL